MQEPSVHGGWRGSLVVKITDSWPVCHKFEPSTAEDPSLTGAMHIKFVKVQPSSRWCGMERRGVPAQVSSSSLDHGSK
ncbi:hypothetical protein TNCV_1709031 [Trichonephila clavipes]|nr:hypothetical protein TNCV_1709031 [Trichonephila clavipes]